MFKQIIAICFSHPSNYEIVKTARKISLKYRFILGFTDEEPELKSFFYIASLHSSKQLDNNISQQDDHWSIIIIVSK